MSAAPPPPAAVDAAIATVLAAEQAARASITQAGTHADDILAAGQAAARRIAARGAQRAARIHDALQRRLADGLAAIDAQRAALQRDGAPAIDEARVTGVAQALARRLTTQAGQ